MYEFLRVEATESAWFERDPPPIIAFKMVRTNKTPGIDGLLYEVYLRVSYISVDLLTISPFYLPYLIVYFKRKIKVKCRVYMSDVSKKWMKIAGLCRANKANLE